MKARMQPKAGRGGKGLLAGLLRCRRCGRMLHVSYTGRRGVVLRYQCRGAQINHGEDWCISFGGLRTDEAIANEVLRAIGGNAVGAALEAADAMQRQRQEQRKSLDLELEQGRYEAKLAARRYEAVDPDNRLVAAELELRWNGALRRVQELENRLRDFDTASPSPTVPDKDILLSLAQDLPAVWNSPTADMRLKQRIVRILIQEIIADVDQEEQKIVLVIHWAGGRHSELRIEKNGLGKHQRCTGVDAIEVVRQMSGKFPDEQIAATLNRLGLRTGAGNTWSTQRVYGLRHYYQLPNNKVSHANLPVITLEEAAHRLGISSTSIRRLIDQKLLPATQVVACAPWEIPLEALENPALLKAVENIKKRVSAPQTLNEQNQHSLFSNS
jgi:excisionase family DNA binding protein